MTAHRSAQESPDEERARLWMFDYARPVINGPAKPKPKRDQTIKLCHKEIKVTYRVAQGAWNALPAEWKSPPRKPSAD